jgi:hypothetical protein
LAVGTGVDITAVVLAPTSVGVVFLTKAEGVTAAGVAAFAATVDGVVSEDVLPQPVLAFTTMAKTSTPDRILFISFSFR